MLVAWAGFSTGDTGSPTVGAVGEVGVEPEHANNASRAVPMRGRTQEAE